MEDGKCHGGRVKDFSNLSSASLCLRCIHKLGMHKQQRRNGEKDEERKKISGYMDYCNEPRISCDAGADYHDVYDIL